MQQGTIRISAVQIGPLETEGSLKAFNLWLMKCPCKDEVGTKPR